MPELAAAFAIGSLVSLLLGLAFTITQLSKYKSNDYRTLQVIQHWELLKNFD